VSGMCVMDSCFYAGLIGLFSGAYSVIILMIERKKIIDKHGGNEKFKEFMR